MFFPCYWNKFIPCSLFFSLVFFRKKNTERSVCVIFFIWKMYKIVKMRQFQYWKCTFYLFIFICKCKNKFNIWSFGIVPLYIQFEIFNLSSLKDTQILHQNGLILRLVGQNSRSSYKNKYVYTLNNLASLINKQFYKSLNLRKVR